MKNRIIGFVSILVIAVLFTAISCDNKIGYLKAENASYTVDSLVIPLVPDAIYRAYPWGGGSWSGVDAAWVASGSNWCTLNIEGVLGTQPLLFSIESVIALNGSVQAADYFRSNLKVVGSGSMNYPLYTDTVIAGTDTTYVNNTPVGRYLVSLRVSNQSYSTVIPNAYIFIVIPNR